MPNLVSDAPGRAAPEHAGDGPATGRRPTPGADLTAALLFALAGGAGLFLAWIASGALLLLFAGLLFAALVDGAAAGLARLAPMSRPWRVGIVTFVLLGLLAAALVNGGASLLQQVNDLGRIVEEQSAMLRRALRAYGVTPQTLGAMPDQSYVDLLLPSPATLFGHASAVFGTALGVIGNMVVISFIGLFVALSPQAYRDGAASLFAPGASARISAVLDEMAVSLRWWLIGQVAAIALVIATLWLALWALGMPNALLLALIAGLFNFIPYVGPVIGAVPVLIAAMPQGFEMLVWVMGFYVLIQSIEGYLVAPMIQRHAINLAPALSLGGLVVFGALFGGMGVALAAPLLAVIRIGVLRLWVEPRQAAGRGSPEGTGPT